MSVVEVGEVKQPTYDLSVYSVNALEGVGKIMKKRIEEGIATEREKYVHGLVEEEFKKRQINSWYQPQLVREERKLIVVTKK